MLPLISLKDFLNPYPDLVLYNANIYTVDAQQPTARAIAILNGRVMAVGHDKEILKLAGSRTVKTDIG